MGIEWSRLQSAPFAPLNQKELARYVHLLDCLKAANITPMVVLHHFSNPPWITSAGGWLNPATIPAFVDYATKLVGGLEGTGLFVEHVQRAGHLRVADVSARRISAVPQMAFRVLPESHQAHGRGARAGEPRHPAKGGSDGKAPEVGIAKNWTSFGAFQAFALWDHLLAEISHHAFNRFVLDEFLGGARARLPRFSASIIMAARG
jgi:beta-glucosidase/6-phospho-beta-glucosidase/beta-galactosidase